MSRKCVIRAAVAAALLVAGGCAEKRRAPEPRTGERRAELEPESPSEASAPRAGAAKGSLPGPKPRPLPRRPVRRPIAPPKPSPARATPAARPSAARRPVFRVTGISLTAPTVGGGVGHKVAAGPPPRPTGRMPRPISVPKVAYPPQARHKGLEGAVTLSVVVEPDGRVGAVKVVRSAHPLLDRAAVSALRRARFKPATNKAGKPVRYRIPRYRYVFRLEE